MFVPLTVVLELEWVMRGFYEIEAEEVCQVLEHLLGMSHVTVERWEAVRDAIDLHRQGLDFSDARHLGSSKRCETLVTFDKRFAKSSNRLAASPTVLSF